MGFDQPAVDAVQQGAEAVAHRYRAGQDALRPESEAAQRRQAQGTVHTHWDNTIHCRSSGGRHEMNGERERGWI